MKAMKILFAEDERAIRESTALFLETIGYDIKTAADGQYAWEMLDDFQPNLLITDIKMPRMSGLELIRKVQLSSKFDCLPTIIISAYDRHEWDAQFDLLKVSATLTKPFTFMELKSQIEKISAQQ